jgi:cholesterol 25-hydroxylase
MSLIFAIRITVAITISLLVLCPHYFQRLIDQGYSKLYESRFFNASYFETAFTVLSYAFFEDRYIRLFLKRPELRFSILDVDNAGEKKGTQASTRPRMKRPSKRIKEALIYVAPLLLLDLLLIKKYAGVNMEEMMQSGGFDMSSERNKTIGTFFLRPNLHNFTTSSPLQLVRALPQDSPTSRRITLELITSMVIYDGLFFAFHLSLHTFSFLRSYHIPHHFHAEIHPQVTNQLHIIERLGLVLLANFSLNIIGSHVVTRMLFIPLFTWLLVEIHSGIDLPLGYEKIMPVGWGAGARKHALHHRLGTSGYEPFFCWWDNLWEGK